MLPSRLPRHSPLLLLIAFLSVNCQQNPVGPTATSSQPPPLSVTPSICYVNQPAVFTATIYPADSTNKDYVWQFYDHTDTVMSKNTITKTFSSPGKYGYVVSVYHYTKSSHALIARDTGTFTVYKYASSIAPSHLHGLVGGAYRFQVHADSFFTTTNFKYTWKIGDSVIVRSGIDTINFLFKSAGVFPITVQIEDAQLGIVSAAEDVVAVGPMFQFITVNPGIASIDQGVHFRIYHPSMPAQQHYNVQWSFGDGKAATGPQDVDSIIHPYPLSGKYLVTGRVVDAFTGEFLFAASDTAIASPIDPTSLKLSPHQGSWPTGSTILFTAQHPALDNRHTYHWLWTSDGEPQQIVATTLGDTASFTFRWTGASSVSVTLIDDNLNMALASDTARLSFFLPTGFTQDLLLQMSSAEIHLIGHHRYNGEGYIQHPETDLSTRVAGNIDSSFSHDTIALSFRNGSSSFGNGRYGESTGRYGNITIILSKDGQNCVSAIESNGWDYFQVNPPAMGQYEDNRTTESESTLVRCSNVPLVSFSADSVCFGIHGPAARIATDSVYYSNHTMWTHGAPENGSEYISTDWNAQPTPEILIVFRR